MPAFNPDHDREPLPTAVAGLRAEIAAADALVFCTPEYAGTLPGSLKNLLDWTVGGTEISAKPVVWINVAAPGRGHGAIATLETVLGYVSADVLQAGRVELPIAGTWSAPTGSSWNQPCGTGLPACGRPSPSTSRPSSEPPS